MRRGDAKPRRAARRGRSPARLKRARGLGPRAFPAKRRTQPRAKAPAFARKRKAARVERPGRLEIRMRHVIAEAVASFPGAPCGESLATRP